MARSMRVFLPGGFYHVYCRVARGEYVFDDPGEVERWVDVVAFVARLHDLQILAWCLMANHYHLTLRAGTIPLHRAMASMQGRYAREFNRQRRYRGRLWQSRYKTKIILDDEHLKHAIAYVHLNPVAAGIVDDPVEYRACGHREVIGLKGADLCDVGACLSCFDQDPGAARTLYLERLRAVAETRWSRAGVRDLPWWRSVRDDERTVAPRRTPADAQDFRGQPVGPEAHHKPSLTSVLMAFEELHGISSEALRSGRRTRILAWYRSLFATFSVSWLGHAGREVARALEKCPSSVSKWVAEGMELQLSEPSYREVLDHLATHFHLEDRQ